MRKITKRIISLLLCVVVLAGFAATAGAVETLYGIVPYTEGGGYVYMLKSYYQPGEIVTIRAVPDEGFVFYSWVTDDVFLAYPENDIIQFYMPAQDVEISAVFAIKQPEVKETVSVTFNSMGGTDFGTKYVEIGGYLEEPATAPVKTGYIFDGWYTDATCTLPFTFSTPIYNATILYAKWSAVQAEKTNEFTDVNEDDWFCDCVKALAEKNIISGMGNNTFAPKKNISRAQFVTILANLEQANLSGTETPFDDVPTDAWYAKAVAWAYNEGIVTGVGAKTFAPNANISRQDMAVMLMRYVENVAKITLSETVAQAAFADDSSISSYAREAVYAMQRAAVIGGKTGNVFDPKGNATRAESAKMIYVLMGMM
ncbi:MAG: S-layer homology domain-containing protein [Oscillospiraceae bacterium]|nr:S-layer homology domain-containing protein [Oscillospiraceae bacterium]